MAELDPLGGEPEYNPNSTRSLTGSPSGISTGISTREPRRFGYGGRKPAPLREIIEVLRQTYCGKIGCEYMYIQRPEEKPGCSSAWSRRRNLAARQRREAAHSR